MFGWGTRKTHQLLIDAEAPIALARNETVLNAALRAGIDFPHSCKVGGCGSCKCRLLSGKVRELTDSSYLLGADELRDGIILGCQSIPLEDVRIALPEAARRVAGELAELRMLTRDIAEIAIRLDAPVRYRPGQHALLRVDGGELPARCYSFARPAPPEGSRDVRFFVRRLPGGRLSGWLTDTANLGRRVSLSGGLGDFHLRDGTQPLLCVAGGSGLAPLMALLEAAADTPAATRPVHLLMGARTRADLYGEDAIRMLAARWQAPFRYLPVLSEEPAGSDWPGLRGWVTDAVTAEAAAGAQGYLCGPPPMIDAAITRMQAHGIVSSDIFFDKFSDQSGGQASC